MSAAETMLTAASKASERALVNMVRRKMSGSGKMVQGGAGEKLMSLGSGERGPREERKTGGSLDVDERVEDQQPQNKVNNYTAFNWRR